jgi:hypothetical protein
MIGAMTEAEYLYVFGYETPDEARSNQTMSTDFESSAMLRILAKDEAAALEWGREVSEQFVKVLFGDSSVSWKRDGFACWIEDTPDESTRSQWSSIPVVAVGEFPDFHSWDPDIP